jgi:hypothetical protein
VPVLTLDTLLARLSACGDPSVRAWAEKLQAGDRGKRSAA